MSDSTDQPGVGAGATSSRARTAAAIGLAVAGVALVGVVFRLALVDAAGGSTGTWVTAALLPNTLQLNTDDGRPLVGARCAFFSEVPGSDRRRVARAVSDAEGLVDYHVPAWAAPDGWLGLEIVVEPGVVAFRGRVASLRGAHLVVPRARLDACQLHGAIRLHDPRTTLWMTAVLATGRDMVLGSSGTGRRDLNEHEASRIRFDDVDAAEYAGAVELVALGVGDGEGLHVVALRRFPSLSALRAAVRFGTELVAPRRTVVVPAEPAVDRLQLLATGPEHHVRFRLEPSRFDGAALPRPEYAVVGEAGGRAVALGVLRVGSDGIARVEWEDRLPGRHGLTIAVRDSLGRPPLEPVEVTWSDSGGWNSGGRTDRRGELVCEGLPDRALTFRAESSDLEATARLSPDARSDRLVLRLRRPKRWLVVPEFPSREPVDAHAALRVFELEPVLDVHEARGRPERSGVVSDLEPGPTLLTLAGAGGWFGAAEVDVVPGGGRIVIPVRRLPRVLGEIHGERAHRAAEVVVGSIDYPDLPRLSVRLQPDRSFAFLPQVPGPWTAAVRDYEGALLALSELRGSSVRIELR